MDNYNSNITGLSDVNAYDAYIENAYITNLYLENNPTTGDLTAIIAKNTEQDARLNTIDSQITNINNTNNSQQSDINLIKGEYLRYLGNWSDVEPRAFMKNDIVRYNGSAWVMTVDNYTDDVNPEDSDQWKILAQKGEKGDSIKGDSGLDELLAALGIITLGGILIPMSLATLVSRLNSIPDIQNDIDDLQNDINNDDSRISALEQKTKYQTALNNINRTSFNSDLFITDASGNDVITLNRATGKIDVLEVEGNNVNVNNNLYVAENTTVVGNSNLNNLTALGDCNLGGSILSGKTVNLNGFVYVNGFPLSFITAGNFFEQW